MCQSKNSGIDFLNNACYTEKNKKCDRKGTEVMYKMPTAPGAHPDNVVKGEKYRITVLADGLFRLEYDETGVF